MKTIYLLLSVCWLCAIAACQSTGEPVAGYFAADELPHTLNLAVSSMQEGANIQPMLSAVVVDGNRAKVAFSPPIYPKGLSFSLENLNARQRSDTLAFTLQTGRAQHSPQSDLVMFCVLVVMQASAPDMAGESKAQVEKIIASGGTVVVNGWQYTCLYDEQSDPMIFSFSAQKMP